VAVTHYSWQLHIIHGSGCTLFNRHANNEDCVVDLQELPCGHFMHSHCFGQYTRYNYTCPLCSKSLGDMAVYFQVWLKRVCDLLICVPVEVVFQ
jgi:Ring finger domain